jgi:hypothetical protein
LIKKDYECSRAAINKTLQLDPANKIATTLASDENVSKATGACELIPAQAGVGNE